MRLFYLLSTLFIIQIFSSECFAQWTWRNPLPQGNNLFSVITLENEVVIAGGDCSTIMRSTDNGLSWDVMILNENRINDSFCYLDFPDPQTGYAGTYTAVLYKTTDGGLTWDSIFYDPDDYFVDICFISPDTGFSSTGDKLMKTTDGGFTWEDQQLSDAGIADIDFPSTLTGYIIDPHKVLKSTDMGITWHPVFTDSALLLNTCDFLNEQEGIVLTQSDIFIRTSDGGNTWTYDSLPKVDHLTQVKMLDSNTILLSGYLDFGQRTIYRSIDGGSSWDSVYAGLTFKMGNVRNGVIFCAGWTGKIDRSDDYGATWKQVTPDILTDVNHYESKISDIDFPDSYTGYAVSHGSEGCNASIIKTIDGGDSWFQFEDIPDGLLFNVEFITAEVGCVTGTTGIYTTLNGGASWNKTFNTPLEAFRSELDFNGPIGFVAGTNGLVLKSIDMGQSWMIITNAPQNNYYFVEMVDDQTVYLLGKGKKISKSTDLGVTWEEIATPYFINSVYFFNSMEGIGTGEGIFKTNDGGMTWDICYDNSEVDLYNIDFYNYDTGYVCGNFFGGIVLKTTDHGLTWQNQYVPTTHPVFTICATPDYKFYLGSNYGALMGTTNGGGYTGISTFHQTSAGLDAYPNPVQDICNLVIKEPNSSDAVLQVYDMTGKEIKRINLSKANVEKVISVDMRVYAPGIYICRMTSGDKGSSIRIIRK